MKSESYKGENTDEIVWLRLNRLKSINLCEKVIKSKFKSAGIQYNDKIGKLKAKGLSSAIESAIGYWESNSKSLNARVLSRYYFMLQLTIAEQVSNVNNNADLSKIQKHTEQGHGLGVIRDTKKSFPNDYFTFSLKSGHFYSYVKSLGLSPKEFSLDKRPRKFNEIDNPNLVVNIDDLFRRIPELNNVIEEYLSKAPLSFRIGHSEQNMFNNEKVWKKQIAEEGNSAFKNLKKADENSAIISFYESSQNITIEYLSKLNLPFYDYSIEKDSYNKTERICAKFDFTTKYWYQALNTYSSNYSSTSIIAPLWNDVNDPIIINFALLYTLSIIVRYLPDLWYDIQSGELNHYGSLIEYYISTIDHVLPLKMLSRITGTEISIHQPGSLFGPI